MSISTQAFVVKTKNSTYRFGKAGEDGGRTVSRDEKSLNFTRCKIRYLVTGQEMELDCLDGASLHWYTTSVQSVEE